MNIAIVGTGYVGLVTGTCFSEFGVSVTCVDNDEKKIEMLKRAEIPFYEPGLSEMVKRNAEQGRLNFTSSLAEAIKDAQVVFIAVGTPSGEDGSADLQYVEQVAKEIAQSMEEYKVVVNKSTVPVGTGEKVRQWIKDTQASPIEFDVVSNPEFLREGSAIDDFMKPDRVVLGIESDRASEIMKELYNPLISNDVPFVITNIKTAELIKYASNAFLATKLSFIHEMAQLCDKVGANVDMLAHGMGLDTRIGLQFLHAGPGYGGSCFPKDTQALVKIGKEHEVRFRIVEAAIEANDQHMQYIIQRIEKQMGDLNGKLIGVLGLAFKANTDDIRESRAVYLIEELIKRGARIKTYDPAAMENVKKIMPDLQYANDAYETCQEVDAVVLATEWNEFKNLDLGKIKSTMKNPVFFDLRGIYPAETMSEHGFTFVSIGRP